MAIIVATTVIFSISFVLYAWVSAINEEIKRKNTRGDVWKEYLKS